MGGPSLARYGVGYGAVGILQLLADWFCFVLATALGLDAVPANLIARLLGACLGFWLNGLITFRDHQGSRLGWRRFMRFAVSWSVMSVLGTLAIHVVENEAGLRMAWLAKPVIDVCLAFLGFLASRYWIYK